MKRELFSSFLRWFPSFRNIAFDYAARNALAYRIEQLDSLKGSIKVVYDIGANQGDWTRMASKFLSESSFYLFEANDGHRAALQTLGHPYFISVLSDRAREVQFFGTGNTGDSYYRENTVHYDDAPSRVAQARALDDIVHDENLPLPDFIKLDTQGSELDILRGGTRALGHARLIFLECPILTYNLGAPKIQDCLDFFDTQGFFPLDICEKHYFAGSLVQADFLFIRKGLVPTAKRLKQSIGVG